MPLLYEFRKNLTENNCRVEVYESNPDLLIHPIFQLCIRMMTFILNGVVLRYISKELLGVVNVR